MIVPVAFTERELKPKRIVFTMASPPSTFNITNADLRYDKDFAFSFRLDDGWIDCYYTAFPYFNGGDVVYLEGVDTGWAGLYYTDGCGNDVNFKASYCINVDNLEVTDNPLSVMNASMVNELYVSGWDLFNHGHTPEVRQDWYYTIGTYSSVSVNTITMNSAISGIEVGDKIYNDQNIYIGEVQSFDNGAGTVTLTATPEDTFGASTTVYGMKDSFRDSRINNEIDTAQTEIRNTLGFKMLNFTAPSNEELYDPITAARATAGTLKVVNNVKTGARYIGTDFTLQEWFDSATRTDGIGAAYDFNNVSDPIMTRTSADQQFIVDHLATMQSDENAWFTVGCHRVNYTEAQTGFATSLRYLTFKDFFDRLEATWGKSGDDSMWFAPVNEIYEYWITKENTVFNTVIEGNTVTVTCDFSNVDVEFREHALSLLIDSDVDITNITFENFDTTSFSIGHVMDNTTALVNATYKPDYDNAVTNRGQAEVLVKKAETTQSQSDFDTAQVFIDTLPNGSFTDDLQTRLDAITIIPDSKVYQIDFGLSIGGRISPFPWNNFDETGVGFTAGSTLANLTATDSSSSTITVAVTNSFSNSNGNTGGSDGDSNNPYVYAATRDGFEANGSNGLLTFSNLDPSKVYDFEIYGSRGFIGGTTTYNITGSNSDSVQLLVQNNGNNNTYTTVTSTGISPNGSNEITFEVVSQGFLNVIQLTERNP